MKATSRFDVGEAGVLGGGGGGGGGGGREGGGGRISMKDNL